MKRITTSLILLLSTLLLSGCASQKKDIRFYSFDDRRGFKSDAPIIAKHEINTVITFSSAVPEVSVYAYDSRVNQRGAFLGKTPFSYSVMSFHITEFANLTAEYAVDYKITHRVTKPVDFSDAENDYGEIAFDFIGEKKGYKPEVYRLYVKATNQILLMALTKAAVPMYDVEITLKK